MIGILDLSHDARELLMNIAAGSRGQLVWFPHPRKEWYWDDDNSPWREHEGHPVWVWRSPDGKLGHPASLLTVATLRVLQAHGLVDEEYPDDRFAQPVLLRADGKTMVNWLYWDGWKPGAQAVA